MTRIVVGPPVAEDDEQKSREAFALLLSSRSLFTMGKRQRDTGEEQRS